MFCKQLKNPQLINSDIKRNRIQITIFFSITYGLTYLFFLISSFTKLTIDPNNLAIFMVILPISSVSIAKFYTEGKDNINYKFNLIITMFFISYLILFLTVSLKIISNDNYLFTNYLLLIFSSIYILIHSSKKEDYNIFKNLKIGVILILYFMLSQLIPQLTKLIISGNQINYNGILSYLFIPITCFFSIYIYFGEEYGWRYFLQDNFFKKFGKRRGILLLSICWSLWHLPLDLLSNSKDTILVYTLIRILYGIGFSIYLGYVYIRTENLWFCSIIHALNNSLSLITFNSNSDIIYDFNFIVEKLIFMQLFYIPFIFSKFYKDKDKNM